jgi:ribosomal-protein-alanine N-acetyltransferase
MSVIERILRRDADVAADNGLIVETMRKRDLKAGVFEIERLAYPKPWSSGVFHSEIDQMKAGTRHYIIARRGGRIVGHGGLWFTADEAHVTNVAVHPDARRSGVATTLMLVLADEAIRRGCDAWTLEVRVSSTGAQALYRHFGFAPAGVRQRYYENSEDAIVMWCHDIGSDEYRARLDSLKETLS